MNHACTPTATVPGTRQPRRSLCQPGTPSLHLNPTPTRCASTFSSVEREHHRDHSCLMHEDIPQIYTRTAQVTSTSTSAPFQNPPRSWSHVPGTAAISPLLYPAPSGTATLCETGLRSELSAPNAPPPLPPVALRPGQRPASDQLTCSEPFPKLAGAQAPHAQPRLGWSLSWNVGSDPRLFPLPWGLPGMLSLTPRTLPTWGWAPSVIHQGQTQGKKAT